MILMPRRENVRPEKLKAVEDLAKLINNYPITGIINIHKFPASALQKTRRDLGEKALIKVVKTSILVRALEKTEKKDLLQHVGKWPGLILTDMNPFKLSKFLRKNKSFASAKAGDIAPKDIEIKAGPTDLPPGPAISTLTKVKIPAKVEAGKIAVMKDKIVLKAGEQISGDLAAALQLLKIQPMEIGLELSAIWENKTIYQKDVLSIDEEKLLNDLIMAHAKALNLCLNINYPTKETVVIFLAKARMEAEVLKLNLKTEVK